MKERRKAAIESRNLKKRQMEKAYQSSSNGSKEFTTRSSASVGYLRRKNNQQNMASKAQTTPVASVGSTRPNRQECPQCGKCHLGECQENDRGFFKCGSLDHFIRDCPEMDDRGRKQDMKTSSASLKRMDWLASHGVVVDCGRKVIELRCGNGDVLRVGPDESDNLPMVILSLTAEKYLKKKYKLI
ncbi:uncharacterized protein [Gossypium hirsutum]|uniref:Gag-Pol polyprotein n=1 Tax=Gossypium hirsutum TaxID=3635 RepID=A0A1U8PW69_GOSHI|nr:uncharacterized protein LOC107963358 [Gossypium hirsutum]